MPLSDRQQEFSAAVIQQLGGKRFIAMTGSTNFVVGDDVLTFKVGSGAKQGIKYVRITLTSMDLYKVDFISLTKNLEMKTVASHDMIYDDMLQEIFTQETGFYTHF